MMTKQISVIIPAYNGERFVSESIGSVLEQTLPPDEVIVVDDGSTDRTAELVRSFGNDVRYLWKPNGGPPSARNHGLKHARGEFIAFQDSDDLWIPEKLELQFDVLNRRPEYAMVYSDLSEVDERLQVLQLSKFAKEKIVPREGWIFSLQATRSFIFPQTTVIRRDVFDTVGPFREDLRLHDDTDLFNRITYRFQVGYVAKPTVLRRRHNSNLTNNYDSSLPYLIQVLEGLPKEFSMGPLLAVNVRSRTSRCHTRLARYYLGRGRLKESRSEAARSLRLIPFPDAAVCYLFSFLPAGFSQLAKRLKDKFRGLYDSVGAK